MTQCGYTRRVRITELLFSGLFLRGLLASILISSWSTVFAAERTTPSARAKAFYEAFLSHNVDDYAPLLHSRSLAGHRRYLEIAILKLQRIYGDEPIEVMLGRSVSEMILLNDWEYFRLTFLAAAEISQVEPKLNTVPPEIVAEIAEESTVYVVAILGCSFEESGRRLDLRMPDVLTFRRENDEWKIDCMPFAISVACSLEDELAKAAKAVP